MKKWMILILTLLLLTACGQNKENDRGAIYMNITAEEAKKIMDSESDYVILDVRTQEEYDQGHIPGAIVISHDEIAEKAERVLKNKDQYYVASVESVTVDGGRETNIFVCHDDGEYITYLDMDNYMFAAIPSGKSTPLSAAFKSLPEAVAAYRTIMNTPIH